MLATALKMASAGNLPDGLLTACCEELDKAIEDVLWVAEDVEGRMAWNRKADGGCGDDSATPSEDGTDD